MSINQIVLIIDTLSETYVISEIASGILSQEATSLL